MHKLLLHCCVSTHIGDVDFCTGPYTVTFPSGVMKTTVHIPVINDAILEGTERFNIRIDIDTFLPKDININLGTFGSTTIIIVDTTGEYCLILSSQYDQNIVHRTCHYY